jgi:two-component system cell cycle response regulator DivK
VQVPPFKSARKKPIVLIADDFEDGREMYGEYLSFLGFQVETACDGEEALRKAVELEPDVILMDMSMPVLDGWQATRLLRENERTREIPIVGVSGHVFRGAGEKAIDAGCDSFVGKPALPEEVAEEIRRLLKERRTLVVSESELRKRG